MKLPVWVTTVTPFSKCLAMSLFVILPLISFYLGLSYQKALHLAKKEQSTNYINATSISPIPTLEPSVFPEKLQEILSYELPDGWKVEDESDNYIVITSPGYDKQDHRIRKKEWAMIQIAKGGKDGVSYGVGPLLENYQVRIKQVGTNTFFNAYGCYEGCSDGYYLEGQVKKVKVFFVCSPKCDNRLEFDNHRFSKDRDNVLGSLVLSN